MKNILVIGAGLIGSRHAKAVRAHPRCKLAGVVDPDKNYHPPDSIQRFFSLDQVDVPVDGAIIASPTGLHGEHGQAVAARGWDMLIEKPVAETVEQADALDQAVKRSGVHALVGHHRRYHATVQMLRDTIAGGRIGKPVTSTLIWSMRKPDAYFDTAWRRVGGSPVMINLIHDIDLLRFVLGDIVEVTGFASQQERNAGRIESGAVALRFASGLCGTIGFADTAPSPWGFEAGTAENPNIATTGQDMWWITGTKGGISFPSLTLWSGAEDWSKAPAPARLEAAETVPLVAQLDHFIDVMEGRAQPLINITDARQSLEVTRQVEDSLVQGMETRSQNIQVSV